MIVTFNDYSWNTEDLLQCKNAVRQIVNQYGLEAILELDEQYKFGSLDIRSVLEEYFWERDHDEIMNKRI
jgi:hypothetical protein